MLKFPNPFWKRFWAKVEMTPTCWLWRGGKMSGGYGHVWQDNRHQPVHRMVYSRLVAPIPEGLDICHHCDRPECCRPDHLFVGTHRENMHDAMRKGRLASLPGSQHPMAKLTEAQVAEIRARYDPQAQTGRRGRRGTGGRRGNGAALGREFGVNQTQISKIILGKVWRHTLPWTPP
jgi:hypothetical protein